MSPVGLSELLAGLPRNEDPNLLVGFDTRDDAGVYKIDENTALVTTADFITPPVDDPYLFGQIAAANALSDIYAMGARPVTCLNLLGFPQNDLGPEVLQEIVKGALSKITEAGAVLAGGHSTEDDEPKFGLSVTGLVHPEKFWTNSGARVGDVLFLTKPLGSGVLFNAQRKGWPSQAAFEACLEAIIVLNRAAAEVLHQVEVHAVTDVTGFGLAGHGLEMAEGSDVSLRIELDSLPLFDEALAMYQRGMTTGVNLVNRCLTEGKLRFERELPHWHEEIVFDPQTSGGLLAAVAPAAAEGLEEAFHQAGVTAARRIGVVAEASAERLLFL